MIADAAELQLAAERRLGEMLVEAKGAGRVKPGQPPKKNTAATEAFSRVRLRDAGVDHKLSAAAQKLASVPERRYAAMLAENRQKILAGGARLLNPQSKVLVSAHKERRRRQAVALSARKTLRRAARIWNCPAGTALVRPGASVVLPWRNSARLSQPARTPKCLID